MKYETEAKQILEFVGGKENIVKATHCFTRLRFDLVNNDKAQLEQLDSIGIVNKALFNNGQLQVIIGNKVDEVYADLIKIAGLSSEEIVNEHKDQDLEKKNIMDKLVEMVTQIFIPIFPALVAGGLSKAILVALTFAGMVDATTTTYGILNMIGDAAFYFLPILLAYTSAKYFKANPFVAVVIAAIMIHPNFATLGDQIDFFGLPIQYVNYSATVFPIIIGVYIMSWVEKGLKRIIPKIVSFLFVPLLTIFIMTPLMLCLVGPVINTIANAVGNGSVWLLQTTGIFGGIVFGGVYPILVFFGLHQAIPPIELQQIAQIGIDPILGFCAVGNAAVAGTTLMIAIKSKRETMKSLASTSAFSAIIGITEPALYGVVSNYRNAFISCFVGGAAGGIIISLFGVVGIGIGPVPLAGIALFLGDKFLYYVLAIVVSVIVSMITLAVLGLKEEKE
ncbi:PTS transporter subunit EIIC [Merdibacter massiliensis]|uniref:PTS transporter subunit EIIC n=1 Tax=Merdibacter massiliensis TaxID=1871030 RepID=UPI00096A6CF1|nr:PTS transporter subunit EIIC [Merdibacter massiliensis]